LANGNTLISNQFDNQVIEINPQKKIVFSQGWSIQLVETAACDAKVSDRRQLRKPTGGVATRPLCPMLKFSPPGPRASLREGRLRPSIRKGVTEVKKICRFYASFA
jgi:hypothetical protein